MTKRKMWALARLGLVLGLVALLAVGCSDSDDDPVVLEGVFIDSPVQGLGFETPTQSGVTDEAGTFWYEEGQTIGFYLGDLFLGQTPAKPRISPLDLVEGAEDVSHPAVTNMSRLLLSLDGDCDTENGIQIGEAIQGLFEAESLDFSLSPEAFGQAPEVIALFAELNDTGLFACEPVTLWEPLAARVHLRESLGLEPPQYSLTVATEGEGTVEPDPAGQTHAEGTEVTLTAQAAQGWVFGGWSGDLDGDAISRTLIMDQDRAVVATFNPIEYDQYSLTAATEGQGSVSLDPAGGTYNAGTLVNLTATPAEGWEFVQWSGDLSSEFDAETLIMDENKSVTAHFRQTEPPTERFVLTTNTQGEGEIDLDPSGGVYPAGTSVGVTATPGQGWVFSGWQGDLSGAEPVQSLVMETDKAVTAVFTQSTPETPRYPLILSVVGNGQVNIEPASEDGRYAQGSSVTLSAVPDAGWTFAGWEGAASGEQPEITVVMDGEKTLTARFDEIEPLPEYTLELTLIGAGGVSRDPAEASYPQGSDVSLVATPDAGWVFAGWSGDIEGTDTEQTLVMDADKAVTATFTRQSVPEPPPSPQPQPQPADYTLTVNTQGQGTVAPDSGTYTEDSQVTLTATPASGWRFDGWSGDIGGVSPEANPISLVMSQDRTVTASFAQVPQYALTVTIQGQGTVTPNGGSYAEGTEVTVTAQPAEGWVFSGWSGDLSGGQSAGTVTMDGDKSVTAQFTEQSPDQYSLTVNISQNQGGSVSLDPAGGTYDEGTEVSLTADPDDGWEFTGWSGDLDGDAVSDTVTMDGNKTVEAAFSRIQYSLTTDTSGNGQVSLDPAGGTHDAGTEVTLTADPDDGWEFTGWSGDLSGADNPATLVMDGDKSVTAQFTELPPDQYSLTVNISQDQGGSVSLDPAGGTYDEGTEVTLTADPDDGWEFTGWSGDLDGDAVSDTVTMDGNKTVEAAFSRIQYSLTTDTSGNGQVSLDPAGGTYDAGTEVSLTADPDDGWKFTGWTGDLADTENPVTVTMDANKSVTAGFQEMDLTLSGQVSGRGLPVGAAQVKVGETTVNTDDDGNFSLSLSVDQRIHTDGLTPGGPVFPVKVSREKYATAHAKVPYDPDKEAYTANIKLIPVTHELGDDADLRNRVDIEKNGEKIGELTIPESAFPAGVTDITGNISYIDPTTEDIDSFPGGDFLAVREGDPDNFAILESYGLMEFDLEDQNGNPITDLEGDATVCMKIPGTLTVSEGDTIPLWWYDPESGLWREEGQGTVEKRADDTFWVCGTVSHFTWWNYDEPIETHSCFKFHFIKEGDGTPITEFQWYAEGVSYGGTSPERSCECDSDDPAPPCPFPISSFTVKRNEQIRVYAVINNGTRYYLKDDGDGTYSLITDAASAIVFDTPDLQGSCMWNQNVENCWFLDGPNGDGIVPVGGINYAPSIHSFTISDPNPDGNGQVDAGETATLTVEVTDAEGDAITPDWQSSCPDGTFANESHSGSSYSVEFTAPPHLAICQVTFTATDAHGNASSATESIWVHGDPAYGNLHGTVYGPDGQAASQIPVRLSREADPDGNWDAYDQVVYTHVDGTFEFAELPCDQDLSGAFGFEGTLNATIDVNGTAWKLTDYVRYHCDDMNPDGCQFDLYFPTRWGTLQGSAYGYTQDTVTFSAGTPGGDTGQEGGGNMEATVPVSGGGYGPIPVPVGTVYVVDPNQDSGEWTGFPVLQNGDAVTADIGPQATGTISGHVYDDNGDPVSGITVLLNWDSNTTDTTDASGYYSFDNLPTGMHSVSTEYNSPIGSANGMTTLFTKDQSPTPVADINGTGCTVNVTLFEYDGSPLPNTEVSLYLGKNESQTTNASGQCTFSELNTGQANLSVWLQEGTEYRGVSRRFPVGPSDSTVNVELQMPGPSPECQGYPRYR